MRPRRSSLLVTLVCLAPAAAAFGGGAEIGGPPSFDFDRCLKPLRPCSDPIVIGIGHHFNGRSEIVAFQSKVGLCIDVDRRRSSSGTCGSRTLPRRGAAIETTGYSYERAQHTASGISGALRPDVAEVRVRYRRNADAKEAMATVAQVDGTLLEAVKETRPFGFFEVAVRGCLQARRFRAAALDAAGNIIGRSRPSILPRARCKPGSASFILIAAREAMSPR
jgi:hypothetical protein